MKTETNSGDDFLNGAVEIAEYIGKPLRATYHLLESRQLPAGKIGRSWVSRKSRITQHYDSVIEGPKDESAEPR